MSGVALGVLAALAALALVSATISAILGMGGGVTLLAGMLLVIPPATVVPVHGVVQLASNSTRLLVFLEHVQWRIVAWFVFAAAVGAALGTLVVSSLPEAWMKVGMGVFILLATHVPKPKAKDGEDVRPMALWIFAPVGLMAGFAGMLVGATGPLIAPFFLRANVLKEELIATKAMCQAFVHLFKLPAFWVIGFDYGAWLPVLALLVGAVIVGTLIGKRLLDYVSEVLFVVLVKVALTLVALKLVVWDGLGRLVG